MNLQDLVAVCKLYRKLGVAVQAQLDRVLEEPSEDNFSACNINALAMIHEFLTDVVNISKDDPDESYAGDIADDILRYVEEGGQTIRYGRIVRKLNK